MTNIFIPSSGPEDWKQFLADPEKHWKTGYSARSLAYCWEEAGGLPEDIVEILGQVPALSDLTTIFAIPEHKVHLPGGASASQNDVWVLAGSSTGLVSIAVEGKVSEPFGPTVEEWFTNRTPGKEERLKFLCHEMGLDFPPRGDVRYQLFHRTVSAILEAKRFHAREAVMVVHSFSQTDEWLADYQHFLTLFGLTAGVNQAVTVNLTGAMNLSFAWVHGSKKYLKL